MSVEWHPKRWWDWFSLEDQKRETDPIFIAELQKCASVVYNIEVLKHFTS